MLKFNYLVDMLTVATPSSGYAVAYDLDGVLKQKDSDGIISQIGGSGTGSGGIGIIDIEYSDLLDLYNSGSMIAGYYKITDRADLGIIIRSISSADLSQDGYGIFMNPDFQNVGSYSGVSNITGLTAGNNNGIWHLNCTSFNYTSGGGVMNAGENITNTTNGAHSTVLYNNGLKIYIDSLDVSSWINGNTCNNFDGDEITITSDGILQDYYPTGDIVIWNGYHYQILNSSLLGSTNPSSAIGGIFGQLSKSDPNVGYVKEVDIITYDFLNDIITSRLDKRGNNIGPNNSGFQWGNDSNTFNSTDSGGSFFNINTRGGFSANLISNGTSVNCTEKMVATVQQNSFSGGGSYVFEFNNLSYGMSGCTINTSESVYTLPSDSYQNMILNYSLSTFKTSIDITGLTAIDQRFFDGNPNTYCGILSLTSSNSSETIYSILYGPTLFPYKFYPRTGLTITFDPVLGGFRTAGGISVIINGSNGDWIEFEERDGIIYQIGGETY